MLGRQNNPDLDEDKAEPCRSKVLSQKSCVFKTLSSTLLLLHILLYARGGINFMAIKKYMETVYAFCPRENFSRKIENFKYLMRI